MHYTCHLELPLIIHLVIVLLWLVVTNISVIPYTCLNIQNGENTPVKQSTRLSSDNLKKILHIHEHKHNRLPDHIQYKHEGLQTEQLALNQIKDLICCAYYTE